MPSTTPPAYRRRAAGVPFILAVLFIDVLGLGLIIPVLPQLVAELSRAGGYAWSSIVGLLIGVYALMQFLCAPVVGALSDRYGRRPVLLVSMLGLALDFLLTYFAPNLAWLFVARAISGATSANITTANAYIADVSPPEERVRNFGRAGAALGLGIIIGPAMGGLLGENSTRLPFLAAAGLSGLNFLYGLFVLPESLPRERRPVTRLRLNPFGAIAALRRYPTVFGLACTILCINLALQALQSTWVLFTAQRFGWTALENGISLTTIGLLIAFVQGGLLSRIAPPEESRALCCSDWRRPSSAASYIASLRRAGSSTRSW
jgi:DHA1 family tetracycline resistance protein-like MFS transporter